MEADGLTTAFPRPAFPASWYVVGPDTAADQRPITRRFCGGELSVGAGHRTAHLRVAGQAPREVPLSRHLDLLFAWYHPTGRAPSFELPTLSQVGWTALTTEEHRYRAHPELVMRDLADVAHFVAVHGFFDIDVTQPLTPRGTECEVRMRFKRRIRRSPIVNEADLSGRLVGLGYQLTRVDTVSGLYRARHLVLPTPEAPGEIAVTLGLALRYDLGPLRLLSRRTGHAVGAIVKRLVHPWVMGQFRDDVAADARYWVEQYAGRVAPAERQVLAAYTRWADRFYSD